MGFAHSLAMTTVCPICKSPAQALDRTGDATGFDCPTHGKFKVADTIAAEECTRERPQRQSVPVVSARKVWKFRRLRVLNKIEFNLPNGNLIVQPGCPSIFNRDGSSECHRGNSHRHLRKDASNDQIDNSNANVGSWYGNRNDGIRSAGLVGWL